MNYLFVFLLGHTLRGGVAGFRKPLKGSMLTPNLVKQPHGRIRSRTLTLTLMTDLSTPRLHREAVCPRMAELTSP